MILDAEGKDAGPWQKMTIADIAREQREALAASEAEAHRKISEMFAGLRAKLEIDLLRMERDISETH